jgi:hypothetical protein
MTYKELLDKLLEFDENTLQEPVTVYVVDNSGHMNAEFSTDVTGFSYETWSYRVDSTTPCLTVNL